MTQENEQKKHSQSFDRVADLYDTYRPGYPEALVEDIMQLSGIQPGGRILEIGSGTGKATLPFARRGYAMVCLEPGQNLRNVAARNLAAYPNVRFVAARFEEWDAGDERFDLIISAQAFHWVPEAARYERTARLLNPEGHLAIFWNMYPGMATALRQAMDQVYLQYAPEITKSEPDLRQEIENRARPLRESRYYQNLVMREYPWSQRYPTQDYLGLLMTYSDHLALPEPQRRLLLEKTAEVLDQNGGFIDRPYHAVVYLAQKASD